MQDHFFGAKVSACDLVGSCRMLRWDLYILSSKLTYRYSVIRIKTEETGLPLFEVRMMVDGSSIMKNKIITDDENLEKEIS